MNGRLMISLALTGAMMGQAAAQQQEPQAGDMQVPAEAQTADRAPSVDFVPAQQRDQVRVDELIGMDVINAEDEAIGEISDLVLDEQQRLATVVLGVGGFLGVGTKKVALPVDAVRLGEETARVDLTAEQLDEAPAFATLAEVEAAEEAARAQREAERQQQQMQQATQPTTQQ